MQNHNDFPKNKIEKRVGLACNNLVNNLIDTYIKHFETGRGQPGSQFLNFVIFSTLDLVGAWLKEHLGLVQPWFDFQAFFLSQQSSRVCNRGLLTFLTSFMRLEYGIDCNLQDSSTNTYKIVLRIKLFFPSTLWMLVARNRDQRHFPWILFLFDVGGLKMWESLAITRAITENRGT